MKKINKIVIVRDTDGEICVMGYRTNRNGVDLLSSSNSVDEILEIIEGCLSESPNFLYRLVVTGLPPLQTHMRKDREVRWLYNYWKTLKQVGLSNQDFIKKFDLYIKSLIK